jgi:hypothetical protein
MIYANKILKHLKDADQQALPHLYSFVSNRSCNMLWQRRILIIGGLITLGLPQAVFASPGNVAINTTDVTLLKATDLLLASQNAVETKLRRDQIHIAPVEKLVRFKHQRNTDKLLILGGTEALPM